MMNGGQCHSLRARITFCPFSVCSHIWGLTTTNERRHGRCTFASLVVRIIVHSVTWLWSGVHRTNSKQLRCCESVCRTVNVYPQTCKAAITCPSTRQFEKFSLKLELNGNHRGPKLPEGGLIHEYACECVYMLLAICLYPTDQCHQKETWAAPPSPQGLLPCASDLCVPK